MTHDRTEHGLEPEGSGQATSKVRRILPVVGTIVLIGYLVWSTDLDAASAAFARADLVATMVTLVSFTLVIWLFDSACLVWLIDVTLGHRGEQRPMLLRQIAAIKAASYILNIINYNAATIGMGWLVSRRKKVGVVEAVAALAEQDFDLVLMDLQMPAMDGLEATAVIRDPESSVRDHDIPIIALTARAMEEDRQRCLDAGMNDHVSKPIEREELLAAIDLHAGAATDAHELAERDGRGRPIDVNAAREQTGGDEDLFREVLGMVTTEAAEALVALRSAEDVGALHQLAEVASSLKGAAANVAATPLSLAASQVERAARGDRLSDVARLLVRLEYEVRRLEEYRAALPPID